MKLKRIGNGRYASEDGRVEIIKYVTQYAQGGKHKKETTWAIRVDGKPEPMDEMTKKDAVEVAELRLRKLALRDAAPR